MNIKIFTLFSPLIILFIFTTSCSKEDIPIPNSSGSTSSSDSYLSKGIEKMKVQENIAAIEDFLIGLEQAKKRKNAGDMGRYNFYLGRVNKRLDNYNTALDYFSKVLDFPEAIISPKTRAKTFSYIASIKQKQGAYKEAYEYHLEALELSELIKDTRGISRSYYEIGSNFFYQKSYKSALENYEKAKETAKELDDPRIIFSYLSAIGSTYDKLGEYQISLDYNLESLQLAKSLEKVDHAYALQNTGSNYIALKQFDKAKEALKEALTIQNTRNDQWAAIGILRDLGKLYNETKEYDKAIHHLKEGLKIAEEINSNPRIIEMYWGLSQTYENLDVPDQAISYLKAHSNLKDSILNERSIELMGVANKNYELQKKENEIVVLKKNEELAQKNYYILFVILAFTLAILSLFAYWYRSQKQLNNKLEEQNQYIQSQNQTLEEQNQQINQQNEKLEAINHELQQFTSVASHDLRSPLRTITSFTNLLYRRYKDHMDDQAKEYVEFIKTGTTRMMHMINDLLYYARLDKDEIPHEWLDSDELIDEALFNLQENIKEEDAVISIDKDVFPKIKANRTLMVQLFQNLIANAIKFRSDKQPEVQIDCLQNGKANTFFVKDNGIGIDPEYQEKAFKMFGRINGRTEYEGTGIGLATCKKIVQTHGGKIWVESEEGKGSTFFFSIPIQDN